MVGTYTKKQQKDVRSKYHLLINHLESTYELVQEQVFSKFHSSANLSNPCKLDSKHTSIEIKKDFYSRYLKKTFLTSLMRLDAKGGDLARYTMNLRERSINWTRGRFNGDIEKIILKDGLIIEKTFITTKGQRIKVHRSELGIFARFF